MAHEIRISTTFILGLLAGVLLTILAADVLLPEPSIEEQIDEYMKALEYATDKFEAYEAAH